MTQPPYTRRLADDDLDELLPALPAIALEGAKGVGKTRTALGRAATTWRLDDDAQRTLAAADPARLVGGPHPVLIDEWQRLPQVWDLVRRAVDDGAAPGSFLLTGSAVPDRPPTHSGAGRIVSLRMRPLTLAERWSGTTVSLAALMAGGLAEVSGQTDAGLEDYVEELLASGLPGVRPLPGRAGRLQLSGYVDRVVDREVRDEAGVGIRNPQALRRWLAAYAAASSTTTSYEKLRDAASAGRDVRPSKDATMAYRDALARLWLTDDVPAWTPSTSRLRELGQAPKHQLVDPALAATLLGVRAETLLAGAVAGPFVPRDGLLLGALFESLATLCVRAYAARAEARVAHLRTARGRQEVDLVLERPDGRVVAVEVKLARAVGAADGRHLRWLGERIGDRLLDAVIITTGPFAYRRDDGVAVVPLALLGP